MIDLRSDTCSRPTPEMRAAMASAEVGDDVYGDDPTVKTLERATADLLGKEDAVFMPTGTMTNQVGIRVHTQPGDAVLFDQNAHVYILEGGAPAAYSGVLPRLFPGVRGIFTPHDVEAAVGNTHPFFPATILAPTKRLASGVETRPRWNRSCMSPYFDVSVFITAGLSGTVREIEIPPSQHPLGAFPFRP
jgi:threonine aldolase